MARTPATSRTALTPQMRIRLAERLQTAWPRGLHQAIRVRPLDADEIGFSDEATSGARQAPRAAGAGSLTSELMQRLTRIDCSRDMALIATVMTDGRETRIGVARYVRMANPLIAEFVVAVRDEWQGLHVGRQLVNRLIAVAETHGVRRLFGDVPAGNTAMLDLARRLGFRIQSHPDGATLRRVMLDL